jgi:hypothetical protein
MPSLIYQPESGDLQGKWVEDFDHSIHNAYWATSPKGWMSDAHGLAWLDRFHQFTLDKARCDEDKRLLILDGHSSHVNLNSC